MPQSGRCEVPWKKVKATSAGEKVKFISRFMEIGSFFIFICSAGIMTGNRSTFTSSSCSTSNRPPIVSYKGWVSNQKHLFISDIVMTVITVSLSYALIEAPVTEVIDVICRESTFSLRISRNVDRECLIMNDSITTQLLVQLE
jgi:hypothetical protein